MNLSGAIEGYLLFKAARAAPTTIKTDRITLRQFSEWRGDCEVGEVTADDVRAYLEYHRGRGLSPYTIRRHLAVISALYNWLMLPDIELANANPASAVPAPRLPKLKPKALSLEQITVLLGACEGERNQRRNKAVILFMLDTGARTSEVAGVTVGNVDFSSGKVKVRGKGSKERFVYLGRRALAALWLYVKEERPEPAQINDNHLFLTFDGYPFSRHTVRSIMVTLSRRAGIHVYAHQFRHTAAIARLRNGMDLISVQHLLGHETLEVTRGYLGALQDEDVEQRAKRTSPADNWRL